MKRPRPRYVLGSVRALVLTLLALVFVGGQPRSVRADWTDWMPHEKPLGERIDVFRRILFDLELKPLANYRDLNPQNSILIVLGREREDQSVEIRGGLAEFLSKGGAVLVATDQPWRPKGFGRDLQSYTQYTVAPYGIAAPKEKCYRGLDYCPLLEPGPDASALFRNPNEHGVGNLVVATNLPGRLQFPPVWMSGVLQEGKVQGVHVLARLPSLPEDRRVKGAPPAEDIPFMVSRQSGGGRLLLLADHSIFINYMMLPEDNGNVEFTTNCLNWLSGDKRERTNVLLVEDGTIVTNFDVPLKQSLNADIPPIKAGQALDFGNAVIDEVGNAVLQDAENNDRFNKLLWDVMTNEGKQSPWRLVGYLFILLTILALWKVFWGLVVYAFRQQGTSTPPLGRLVRKQDAVEPMIEQRKQGMYQVRNLWEVARELTRQTFESAGIAAKTGDPLPALAVQGSLWQRWKVRRKVARLWLIAFGSRPSRVSPMEWPRLLAQLNEVKSAMTNGSLVIGQ